MKYAVKKFFMLLLTMVAVSFLAFAAFQVVAGDPATNLLGTEATLEKVAALRHELFGPLRSAARRLSRCAFIRGAGDAGLRPVVRPLLRRSDCGTDFRSGSDRRGASRRKGGAKCLRSATSMTSSYMDKSGVRHSRILPHFGGDIVTDPRSQAYYIVTEFGAVNLAGRSTWERAEMLVSIAHPDFREKLIAAAEQQKIWRRSNR